MSLRIFHIVFIVVCVGLSIFVAGWGFLQYQRAHDQGAFAIAALFSFVGVALIAYGVKAFGKLKDL
jgi:hypothetical protein